MSQILKSLFKDGFVILELDSGEKLKISYNAYTVYKICTGLSLSSELYCELQEESQKVECREKAYAYLGLRARSINELRCYLKRKNFSDIYIEETIDFLSQKNYINDYDFSLSYIKSKIKSGNSGKDLIIRDLYRKGIGRKIIDKTLRESGAVIPDEDAVYGLAVKKYMALKDIENRLMKVSNFLRGRGFDYETINKVLRKIKSDFDE